MKRIILSTAATLAVASPLMAEGDALARLRTRLALQRESRGTVLYAEGFAPRLKARLQNLAWKGKTFPGDGTLINRWPAGIEAVTAQTSMGTSLFDGQPCLVMQYAPDAPIFPGVRDELREIAPGTWLGRNYDGSNGAFMGYFLLQAK